MRKLALMSAHSWMCDYLSLVGSSRMGKLWQCPAHPDSYPSMSLEQGDDGKALVFCHAGCSYEKIMSALGLSTHLLFEEHPWTAKKVYEGNPSKPSFAKVSYAGHGGGNNRRLDFQIYHHQFTPSVRLERVKYEDGSKMCKWQTLEGDTWRYSHDGNVDLNALPLYREVDIIQGGYVDEIVVLCESESSVDALFNKGIYATTWAGGASQPKIHRLVQVLKGMRVLWVPDNDLAGLKCSEVLERELKPHVRAWQVLIGDEGEDAKDLVKRSAITLSSIIELFEQAA